MSSDFFVEGISSHKQAKLMHKHTLLSYVAPGVLKQALFIPVKASFASFFPLGTINLGRSTREQTQMTPRPFRGRRMNRGLNWTSDRAHCFLYIWAEITIFISSRVYSLCSTSDTGSDRLLVKTNWTKGKTQEVYPLISDAPNWQQKLTLVASCCLCLGQKVTLEHIAKASSDGQRARTFCGCIRSSNSTYYIVELGKTVSGLGIHNLLLWWRLRSFFHTTLGQIATVF